MAQTPIKIIVPDQQGAEVLARIAGCTVTVVAADQPVPAADRNAQMLVVGPAEQDHEVTAALKQIAQLPQLAVLLTLGQGTEQWTGKLPTGVEVLTARGAHGGSVAEWVLATLLSLVRDLRYYKQNQRDHMWHGRQAQTLLSSNILIYGAGDVGENVRRRLEPFGASVTMVGSHAHDGIIDMAMAQKLLPATNAVVMALPLTADTAKTVDAGFLAALGDGAIVINAGRGGLVDQAGLLRELQSGRLRAALDVTTPEPLPADSQLWEAPHLLLTPHVAGNTVGSDSRAWHAVKDQVVRYLKNID